MISEPAVREESLRAQIALGWVTNLLILCMMLVFMIADSALSDDGFWMLHRDPGVRGLGFLAYLVPYYALMPVYIYLVSGFRLRLFRWVAVATAGLGLAYFILHHLSHWRFGQRPTFSSHVADLTLHAVGLWVLVNSIRWARFPLPVRAAEKISAVKGAVLQES